MPGENGTKAALWLSYFSGRTAVVDFDPCVFIVAWLSIVSRPTWLETSPSASVVVFVIGMACRGGGAFSVVLLLRPMWRTTSVFAASSKMNISLSGHWATRVGFTESISLWTYVILYDCIKMIWYRKKHPCTTEVIYSCHLVVNIFTCLYFIVLSLEILRLTNLILLTMEKIRILF